MLAITEKHLGSILTAAAIIIAATIYAYFNPYQACKRDFYDRDDNEVASRCAGSGSTKYR
jgi:hypothetical protein